MFYIGINKVLVFTLSATLVIDASLSGLFPTKISNPSSYKKFKLCTRYFIANDIPYAVRQNITKIIDLANIVHKYKWTAWPGLAHQLRNKEDLQTDE